VADVPDGIFGSFGSAFLVFGIIIGALFLIALIGGVTYWYLRFRNYRQMKVVVFYNDGAGNLKVDTGETGGIFWDWKSKRRLFFLRKANVGLLCDNVPSIDTGKKKTVFVMRSGLKNYRFLRLGLDLENVGFTVGQEDTSWATVAYERQKKVWWQSLLGTLLPYMMLTVVSIIILIIFIYFFQKLDVLKEFAVALQNTASTLAQAQSPVIPSGP
jgi:hypothetical protein